MAIRITQAYAFAKSELARTNGACNDGHLFVTDRTRFIGISAIAQTFRKCQKACSGY